MGKVMERGGGDGVGSGMGGIVGSEGKGGRKGDGMVGGMKVGGGGMVGVW